MPGPRDEPPQPAVDPCQPDPAAAEREFELFCSAQTLKGILGHHRRLCSALQLQPDRWPSFYPRLRSCIKSWKAQGLFSKFDKRAAHKCYAGGLACVDSTVLVVGAGPCGLRAAIEAQLLGARVVVLEKRDRLSRNNVLHLWPMVIHDLRALGAKKFFGKFCAGSIDHISIRQLQCILLKVALLLGVEVCESVAYEGLLEPTDERIGWRALVGPPNHPVGQLQFDVLIGADGKRNTFPCFRRKEFRGKLAIAITANFVNGHTESEARVDEISGVAFIFHQQWFKELAEATGIELENIVYYKDDTHYFVMTAKKHSLLAKGVLLEDRADTASLLSAENISRERLIAYAREAAAFSTRGGLEPLRFARNHYGLEDVAMFDFTSMYAACHASALQRRHGHSLLLQLVGDSLLEPFWPTGSGCARGFLSCQDAGWQLRRWCDLRFNTIRCLSERESVYRLLAQTTPENLNSDMSAHTIDPRTRYPNLSTTSVLPGQVRNLVSCDDPGWLADQLASCSASAHRGSVTYSEPQQLLKKSPVALIAADRLLRWVRRALKDVEVDVVELRDCLSADALSALISVYRPDLTALLPDSDLDSGLRLLDAELAVPPPPEDGAGSEDVVHMYLTQLWDALHGQGPVIRPRPVQPVALPPQIREVRPFPHDTDSETLRRQRKRKSDALKQNRHTPQAKRQPPTPALSTREEFDNKVKDLEAKFSGHYQPPDDQQLKPAPRVIGRIERSDWNVRQIERKIEENSRNRPPQDKPSAARRHGTGFDVGRRGQNRVSAMAERFQARAAAAGDTWRPATRAPSEAARCHFCNQRVTPLRQRQAAAPAPAPAAGPTFHAHCLRCEFCGVRLTPASQRFDPDSGRFFCPPHLGLQSLVKGKCQPKPAHEPSEIHREDLLQVPVPEERSSLRRGRTPERAEFENSTLELAETVEVDEMAQAWTEDDHASSESDYWDSSSTLSESDYEMSDDEFSSALGEAEVLQLAKRWQQRRHDQSDSDEVRDRSQSSRQEQHSDNCTTGSETEGESGSEAEDSSELERSPRRHRRRSYSAEMTDSPRVQSCVDSDDVETSDVENTRAAGSVSPKSRYRPEPIGAENRSKSRDRLEDGSASESPSFSERESESERLSVPDEEKKGATPKAESRHEQLTEKVRPNVSSAKPTRQGILKSTSGAVLRRAITEPQKLSAGCSARHAPYRQPDSVNTTSRAPTRPTHLPLRRSATEGAGLGAKTRPQQPPTLVIRNTAWRAAVTNAKRPNAAVAESSPSAKPANATSPTGGFAERISEKRRLLTSPVSGLGRLDPTPSRVLGAAAARAAVAANRPTRVARKAPLPAAAVVRRRGSAVLVPESANLTEPQRTIEQSAMTISKKSAREESSPSSQASPEKNSSEDRKCKPDFASDSANQHVDKVEISKEIAAHTERRQSLSHVTHHRKHESLERSCSGSEEHSNGSTSSECDSKTLPDDDETSEFHSTSVRDSQKEQPSSKQQKISCTEDILAASSSGCFDNADGKCDLRSSSKETHAPTTLKVSDEDVTSQISSRAETRSPESSETGSQKLSISDRRLGSISPVRSGNFVESRSQSPTVSSRSINRSSSSQQLSITSMKSKPHSTEIPHTPLQEDIDHARRNEDAVDVNGDFDALMKDTDVTPQMEREFDDIWDRSSTEAELDGNMRKEEASSPSREDQQPSTAICRKYTDSLGRSISRSRTSSTEKNPSNISDFYSRIDSRRKPSYLRSNSRGSEKGGLITYQAKPELDLNSHQKAHERGKFPVVFGTETSQPAATVSTNSSTGMNGNVKSETTRTALMTDCAAAGDKPTNSESSAPTTVGEDSLTRDAINPIVETSKNETDIGTGTSITVNMRSSLNDSATGPDCPFTLKLLESEELSKTNQQLKSSINDVTNPTMPDSVKVSTPRNSSTEDISKQASEENNVSSLDEKSVKPSKHQSRLAKSFSAFLSTLFGSSTGTELQELADESHDKPAKEQKAPCQDTKVEYEASPLSSSAAKTERFNTPISPESWMTDTKRNKKDLDLSLTSSSICAPGEEVGNDKTKVSTTPSSTYTTPATSPVKVSPREANNFNDEAANPMPYIDVDPEEREEEHFEASLVRELVLSRVGTSSSPDKQSVRRKQLISSDQVNAECQESIKDNDLITAKPHTADTRELLSTSPGSPAPLTDAAPTPGHDNNKHPVSIEESDKLDQPTIKHDERSASPSKLLRKDRSRLSSRFARKSSGAATKEAKSKDSSTWHREKSPEVEDEAPPLPEKTRLRRFSRLGSARFLFSPPRRAPRPGKGDGPSNVHKEAEKRNKDEPKQEAKQNIHAGNEFDVDAEKVEIKDKKSDELDKLAPQPKESKDINEPGNENHMEQTQHDHLKTSPHSIVMTSSEPTVCETHASDTKLPEGYTNEKKPHVVSGSDKSIKYTEEYTSVVPADEDTYCSETTGSNEKGPFAKKEERPMSTPGDVILTDEPVDRLNRITQSSKEQSPLHDTREDPDQSQSLRRSGKKNKERRRSSILQAISDIFRPSDKQKSKSPAPERRAEPGSASHSSTSVEENRCEATLPDCPSVERNSPAEADNATKRRKARGRQTTVHSPKKPEAEAASPLVETIAEEQGNEPSDVAPDGEPPATSDKEKHSPGHRSDVDARPAHTPLSVRARLSMRLKKSSKSKLSTPPPRDNTTTSQRSEEVHGATGGVPSSSGKDHTEGTMARKAKQREVRRQQRAQQLQRQLGEMEVTYQQLDSRAARLEAAIRGQQTPQLTAEDGSRLDGDALLQAWFQLVQRRGQLLRREQQLQLQRRLLLLDEQHDQLQTQLRRRMAAADDQAAGGSVTETDKELITTLLDVSEQRRHLSDSLHSQTLEDDLPA